MIDADISPLDPVPNDSARIAQLLSNLIANALSHGASDQPVKVEAFTKDGRLELSVANSGEPIPEHLLERLFEPFMRTSSSAQQGLGLGLYIASEIAKAHRGELTASSTAAETRFTFTMPLN